MSVLFLTEQRYYDRNFLIDIFMSSPTNQKGLSRLTLVRLIMTGNIVAG